MSELILSPEPIDDTGVEHTDALLVLSEDGRKKSGPYLAALAPEGRVFRLEGVDVEAETLESIRNPLAALAAVLARLDLFPLAALEEAARPLGKGLRGEKPRGDRGGGHRPSFARVRATAANTSAGGSSVNGSIPIRRPSRMQSSIPAEQYGHSSTRM